MNNDRVNRDIGIERVMIMSSSNNHPCIRLYCESIMNLRVNTVIIFKGTIMSGI